MVSSSHFSELFLTLAVIAVLIPTGSALTCSSCLYNSTAPKAEQMCGKETVKCSSTAYTSRFCFTGTFTQADGVAFFFRSCARTNDTINDCNKPCESGIKEKKLKSCHIECCKTDNCNNYTLSSASGVMATRFVLSLMVLVAFRVA